MDEYSVKEAYVNALIKTDVLAYQLVRRSSYDVLLESILERKIDEIYQMRVPARIHDEVAYYVRWFVYGYNLHFMSDISKILFYEMRLMHKLK